MGIGMPLTHNENKQKSEKKQDSIFWHEFRWTINNPYSFKFFISILLIFNNLWMGSTLY